jgi:hypothetical protein
MQPQYIQDRQVDPDLLLLFATNPTLKPGLRAPSCKHVEITKQGAPWSPCLPWCAGPQQLVAWVMFALALLLACAISRALAVSEQNEHLRVNYLAVEHVDLAR